jgi:hypothetical protein
MGSYDGSSTSFAYGALGPAAAIWAYLAYDTVWSAAIAIAAAASAKAEAGMDDTHVTGDDVMRAFETGIVPAFEGATGHLAYLGNGDLDLNHTLIEITNYGTPAGASEPRHAVVATVSPSNYTVSIVEGEAIVWSNGKQFPYVSTSAPVHSPVIHPTPV